MLLGRVSKGVRRGLSILLAEYVGEDRRFAKMRGRGVVVGEALIAVPEGREYAAVKANNLHG
jgi:hypothetical protein